MMGMGDVLRMRMLLGGQVGLCMDVRLSLPLRLALRLDRHIEVALLGGLHLRVGLVVAGIVGGGGLAAEVRLQPLHRLALARLLLAIEVQGSLGEGILAIRQQGHLCNRLEVGYNIWPRN